MVVITVKSKIGNSKHRGEPEETPKETVETLGETCGNTSGSGRK